VAVIEDQHFVLSLRASGLGDLLTAVPALRAVSAAAPDARHVLATSVGLEALAASIGGIDVVVPAAVGPDETPPFAPVELAVNLHGSGPQSHQLLLRCRPDRLIAFGCAAAAVDGPEWDPDEHEISRWCRLLDESGIPADPDDLELSVPPGPLPPDVRGATLVHPGAGSPARQWPLGRWAALAAAEVGDGHRVVVTTGPGEASLGQGIAAAVPQVTVVDCSRDLDLLARTVDSARVVVCGDTGVAHLATALRTPSVVLFGPEPPSRWGPPPGRPWHAVLWAGRRGDPHGLRPDPGLLEISVLDVLLEVRHVREAFGSLPGGSTIGDAEVASCAS
jgi:ADP-heptose:LPS heptosyltransferase